MSRTDQNTQDDQPPNVARLKLADIMLLSMGYAHVQELAVARPLCPMPEPGSTQDDDIADKPAAVALHASVKYPVWRALVSYWGDYLTTIDIDHDATPNALTA